MTDPLGQSQVIPYLQNLAKEGYRITILSFEKKQRFEKLASHIKSILDTAGIEWEPQTFTASPPVLSKIYDAWNIKRKAAALHREKNFDFTHCRSYVSAEAGLYLWKKSKVPFLFDMRGFWVDERVDNGQWKLGNPLFRFLYNRYKKKEKSYFEKSHHIISLTWKGKEELINTYKVPAEKVTVIPCCVDLKHFDFHTIPFEKIEEKKRALNISKEETVISYLGSLGGWYLEKEMLDFFVERKKSVPRSKFLFITHDRKESVIAAATRAGANENDLIIQPATRNEVPLYLSLSDLCIFFIKDAYSKKASSPTKQGEIMAMGIPIICNDIGDTGKIIRDSGTGCVISDFSNRHYQQTIHELKNLKALPKETIRNAAFEYFDLDRGVQSYLDVYKIFESNND